MKSFKRMNKTEFNLEKRKMHSHSFGAFPLFCQKCHGYEFYRDGRRIYRWELFDMGYTAEDLIGRKTDIKPVLVTENFEI